MFFIFKQWTIAFFFTDNLKSKIMMLMTDVQMNIIPLMPRVENYYIQCVVQHIYSLYLLYLPTNFHVFLYGLHKQDIIW